MTSLAQVYQLTRLYVLEALRRQVHIVTVSLGFVLLVMPAHVNAFSLGVSALERVATDLGLTLTSYYLVGLGLYLGARAIGSDLESSALYPILARPIPRWVYLAGKFCGVQVVLSLSALFLGLCLMLSVGLLTQFFELQILVVTGFYALESSILAGACIFFSTFCSPPVAGILGALLYLAGGLGSGFLDYFLTLPEGPTGWARVAQAARGLLPNFELLRVKSLVVHSQPVSAGYLIQAALYGLAWTPLFLCAADRVFARRDL